MVMRMNNEGRGVVMRTLDERSSPVLVFQFQNVRISKYSSVLVNGTGRNKRLVRFAKAAFGLPPILVLQKNTKGF